jgi:RsiW-degrading membrane proteinase PrsW (M82 family)
MNTKPSSNKNTVIIGIILVVILAGAWYFYSKGSSSPSTSQLVSTTPGGTATANVGANVLTILNSVSSINIDTSFFSTPAYQSLVDYSITVPPQEVGRQNPFAPVGQ